MSLSQPVDTAGLEEDVGFGSAALEAVTALLLVFVFVGVCYMSRRWICWRCLPAAKSAGKQVCSLLGIECALCICYMARRYVGDVCQLPRVRGSRRYMECVLYRE